MNREMPTVTTTPPQEKTLAGMEDIKRLAQDEAVLNAIRAEKENSPSNSWASCIETIIGSISMKLEIEKEFMQHIGPERCEQELSNLQSIKDDLKKYKNILERANQPIMSQDEVIGFAERLRKIFERLAT